jgi:hypothetical protein
MSKTQWEYDLVERPFCEQLKAMGWQWIEGDKDVPEFTERANFRRRKFLSVGGGKATFKPGRSHVQAR